MQSFKSTTLPSNLQRRKQLWNSIHRPSVSASFLFVAEKLHRDYSLWIHLVFPSGLEVSKHVAMHRQQQNATLTTVAKEYQPNYLIIKCLHKLQYGTIATRDNEPIVVACSANSRTLQLWDHRPLWAMPLPHSESPPVQFISCIKVELAHNLT